jgi:hypothetical protein
LVHFGYSPINSLLNTTNTQSFELFDRIEQIPPIQVRVLVFWLYKDRLAYRITKEIVRVVSNRTSESVCV